MFDFQEEMEEFETLDQADMEYTAQRQVGVGSGKLVLLYYKKNFRTMGRLE